MLVARSENTSATKARTRSLFMTIFQNTLGHTARYHSYSAVRRAARHIRATLYLHSRLLERAAKLSKELGGGSAVLDVSWNTSRFSWHPEGIRPPPVAIRHHVESFLLVLAGRHGNAPLAELIAEMADVVSENGNYLLNFPPGPDGQLTPEQETTPLGNGPLAGGQRRGDLRHAAVEGFRRRPDGQESAAHSGNRQDGYRPKDIRFTTKGKTLYAVGLAGRKTARQ